ncbi:cation:proton antiporter [Natronolimnohabitans innermongolicus]|uniref:Sodium/hydrogen exchanger n=1 Tax=Natronolimnohabitans innermongolicus JCM 12255 TaxID=1227499 RepID=L9XH17_9EURY|nr:cation:proton antiporter [Natronolimnohabitans innermongolicus]ELY59973.1 sodium/hydrogen exchanger [Natronolimnohabitans innermongolicus JCM 12255]
MSVAVPELPIDDPILIFGIAMFAFLIAPLLLGRYRLPGIVGIILIGAAIGPNGIGLLARDETIVLLGEVGIVYLMFVAGLEINLSQFIEYKDRSVVFGLCSFVIPQVVGTVVGYFLLGLSLGAAALFAAIFASHTLLAYPVVSRLGIAKTESVTATIGGTIITDTLALLVLAVVIAGTEGELGPAFWLELTVGLTVFFAGVWLLVPRLGRWFFRTVNQESYVEFLFVMAVLFFSAFFAHAAGIEYIVGAFLAGLVLNRLVPEHGPLMNRIEFVGNALFIPFFLLSVGMLVDVRVLADGPETLTIAAAFVVLVIATKYAAAWVTATRYGYTHDETMTMFGLSVGQAAAALAIVLIGFQVDLFGEAMLNAVVLMILVVSVISPTVVDRYGRAVASAAERTTYDPRSAPQRVMVPFSRDSQYRDRLLDLALFVREPDDEQPLYTLSVAEQSDRAEADVAEIEAILAETEAYTAGAEVPVDPQTRVDANVASGIIRAVLENRITTLVIGWDGEPRHQRVFGSVIDQVLVRTEQLVLVSHVRQPLNTTGEVVVVLPPGIDHNDGFYEAVHTVEHLAEQVGAPIRGVVVDGNPEQFERLFDMVEPDVPATFERVGGWDGVERTLEETVDETDLVVPMSARRGTMGWDPALGQLPTTVARVTDGNFVVLYPAVGDRGDERRFLQFR